jgi:hypothetical protein
MPLLANDDAKARKDFHQEGPRKPVAKWAWDCMTLPALHLDRPWGAHIQTWQREMVVLCQASVSLRGQADVSDVHLELPHTGSEQPIIRFPQPAADFPAHVHLDERKLLKVLRVHPVEVGG